MRDAIDNKISKGDLVEWRIPKGTRATIVRVLEVRDGGLSVISGSERGVSKPMLTIQLQFPVDGVEPGKEAQLFEFLRVVDPSSDALVEGMLKQ